MVLLLDLPPELFTRILELFIRSAGLKKAFLARRVCRSFRDVIHHEVLSRTDPWDFKIHVRHEDLVYYAPEFGTLPTFLRDNLELYLLNHVQCFGNADPTIPNFINRVVDSLMQYKRPSDDLCVLRNRHQRSLVSYVASQLNGGSTFRLLFVLGMAQENTYNHDRWGSDRNFFLKEELSPQEALSAAAAVGNNEALDHFMNEGGDILSQWSDECFFASPLPAAAATGKIEVLEHYFKNHTRTYFHEMHSAC